MNVFVCNVDPVLAAQNLADRHVVKMTLEVAQLLSTQCHINDTVFEGVYRPTHRNHPCRVALDDPGYLAWVTSWGFALGDEYAHRYGKRHKSVSVIDKAAAALRVNLDLANLDVAPRCVHAEHRDLPLVPAYRATLCAKYRAWGPAARWTRRSAPTWAPGF